MHRTRTGTVPLAERDYSGMPGRRTMISLRWAPKNFASTCVAGTVPASVLGVFLFPPATLSAVDTVLGRRCYAPFKILTHNFIRIPGQSPLRLDGFNCQASLRCPAQDLRLSLPTPAAPLKGLSRRLSLRKLLLLLFLLIAVGLRIAKRAFLRSVVSFFIYLPT